MDEIAKIPGNDIHWEAIDIFIFSNGQKYSPPRKYHLHSNELMSWKETLRNLGKQHYGFTCSSIDLFTTSGTKLASPLELKDGASYVAVPPPEQFIKSGYEKYLIRASRSWEKRHPRNIRSNHDTIKPGSGGSTQGLSKIPQKGAFSESVINKSETKKIPISVGNRPTNNSRNKIQDFNVASGRKQPNLPEKQSKPIRTLREKSSVNSVKKKVNGSKGTLRTMNSSKNFTRPNKYVVNKYPPNKTYINTNETKPKLLPKVNQVEDKIKPITEITLLNNNSNSNDLENLQDNCQKVIETGTQIRTTDDFITNRENTKTPDNFLEVIVINNRGPLTATSNVGEISDIQPIKEEPYKMLLFDDKKTELIATDTKYNDTHVVPNVQKNDLLSTNSDKCYLENDDINHTSLRRLANDKNGSKTKIDDFAEHTLSKTPPKSIKTHKEFSKSINEPSSNNTNIINAVFSKEDNGNLNLNIEVKNSCSQRRHNDHNIMSNRMLPSEHKSEAFEDNTFSIRDSLISLVSKKLKDLHIEDMPRVWILPILSGTINNSRSETIKTSYDGRHFILYLPGLHSKDDDRCRHHSKNSKEIIPVKKTSSLINIIAHSIPKLNISEPTNENTQSKEPHLQPLPNRVLSRLDENSLPDETEIDTKKTVAVNVELNTLILSPETSKLKRLEPNSFDLAESPITDNSMDRSTQTEWENVLVEARVQENGQYSFQLPSLETLKKYNLLI